MALPAEGASVGPALPNVAASALVFVSLNDAVAVEPAVTVFVGVVAWLVDVSAVFVKAHEIRSLRSGVTTNDVPMPLGNAVLDDAVAFVHAYVLAYCPRFAWPAAASENVYGRDGRTATVPVVACAVPTVFPVVVADAIDATVLRDAHHKLIARVDAARHVLR